MIPLCLRCARASSGRIQAWLAARKKLQRVRQIFPNESPLLWCKDIVKRRRPRSKSPRRRQRKEDSEEDRQTRETSTGRWMPGFQADTRSKDLSIGANSRGNTCSGIPRVWLLRFPLTPNRSSRTHATDEATPAEYSWFLHPADIDPA